MYWDAEGFRCPPNIFQVKGAECRSTRFTTWFAFILPDGKFNRSTYPLLGQDFQWIARPANYFDWRQHLIFGRGSAPRLHQSWKYSKNPNQALEIIGCRTGCTSLFQRSVFFPQWGRWFPLLLAAFHNAAAGKAKPRPISQHLRQISAPVHLSAFPKYRWGNSECISEYSTPSPSNQICNLAFLAFQFAVIKLTIPRRVFYRFAPEPAGQYRVAGWLSSTCSFTLTTRHWTSKIRTRMSFF